MHSLMITAWRKYCLYVCSCWLVLSPVISSAQLIKKMPDKILFSGYIKNLQTINDTEFSDELLIDNLFHNRLNFKWYTTKNLTTVIEVRNRLFYGSSVKNIPNYGMLIDNNNDVVDLSWLIVNNQSVVLHTMIDRLYLDWNKKKWQIRLGRQRVNWGIGTVWNPNDVFNTFSYFDFDYEEQPGSDAVRVQYYKDHASGFEIVFKAFDDVDEMVTAFMWKANKWNYDFQFIGAVVEKDIAVGAGWAGNIKNAGFKGEWMYYQPYDSLFSNIGAFTGSVSSDYSFKNGIYINGSFLYNSLGRRKPGLLNLVTFDIQPKQLSPYKYSAFFQISYPFTPLINGSLATIFNPGDNALFINPALTFSISENWDLILLSQVFLGPFDNRYRSLSNLYYGRIKWSF